MHWIKGNERRFYYRYLLLRYSTQIWYRQDGVKTHRTLSSLVYIQSSHFSGWHPVVFKWEVAQLFQNSFQKWNGNEGIWEKIFTGVYVDLFVIKTRKNFVICSRIEVLMVGQRDSRLPENMNRFLLELLFVSQSWSGFWHRTQTIRDVTLTCSDLIALCFRTALECCTFYWLYCRLSVPQQRPGTIATWLEIKHTVLEDEKY